MEVKSIFKNVDLQILLARLSDLVENDRIDANDPDVVKFIQLGNTITSKAMSKQKPNEHFER